MAGECDNRYYLLTRHSAIRNKKSYVLATPGEVDNKGERNNLRLPKKKDCTTR